VNQKKLTVLSVITIYALITLSCMLNKPKDFSTSERRQLAQKPKFSFAAMQSGKYAADTEKYVTDQFPLRDELRSLKAQFSLGVMQKQDTNEIYDKDGYLCAMEYPMDVSSIERAGKTFASIYEKHIEGTQAKAYLAVIPDKNFFLAKDSHLSMDYDAFYQNVYANTEFLQPIEFRALLSIEDYYKTDSHLKQDKIIDVAKRLGSKMGTNLSAEYETVEVEEPFYGVYYGQAALPVEPDTIAYCTNETLKQVKVYDFENDKEIPLYDLEKTKGRDPYEMFLGGNISLATIENPNATTDKELVVFGDSFSRSIVPLLAEGYKKITLYDMRYLPSAYIGNYITFTDQDVLFLYSTSVLNNSVTLK